MKVTGLMRYFLTLFWAGVMLALVLQNWNTPVLLALGSEKWTLPLSTIILGVTALTIIPTLLTFWQLRSQVTGNMKQWELKREKAEVKAETSSDQVAALEAKVKTLETALEKALTGKRES